MSPKLIGYIVTVIAVYLFLNNIAEMHYATKQMEVQLKFSHEIDAGIHT